MQEIENLSLSQVQGQIRKYVLTQNNTEACYKIKLQKLRMVFEGASPHEMLPFDSSLSTFSFLKASVVKEIDPLHKIIKFSYLRKFSADFMESCLRCPEVKLGNMATKESSDVQCQDHYMMMSYDIVGQNQDKACISLFEMDMKSETIDPQNFIIIMQQFDKKAQVNFMQD